MIAYTNYFSDARVIKEAETAAGNGFKVDFFCLKNSETSRQVLKNNVMIYQLDQQRYRGKAALIYFFSYFIFMCRCFLKIIFLRKINKYHIIHINNMPDFLVFSVIIPKILGSKIILDIHDPMPNTYLSKFLSQKNLYYKILLWQEKVSCAFADQIITVNEPVKRDVLVADGIPETKISVIANFAEKNLFNPHFEYKIDNKIKLIFHGTIAERFGFENILQAILLLNRKDQIHLKILGEGDYSKNLNNKIKAYQLSDTVSFDNKVVPVEKLPEILREFHLGIVSYLPSPGTEYMLPVKMMELFAMGIPCITVSNKAIKYYFSDDDYFQYDPDNVYSLVNLLNQIMNNPSMLISMRKNLLTKREIFLWENEGMKYLKILHNLST